MLKIFNSFQKLFIRIFDILFSLFGLVILSPIMFLLFIIGIFCLGSPLFIQERVGREKKPFKLLKFRSMYIDTESMATHLVKASSINNWGAFLRKSKLDELPQLYNVLMGDMSFVGPRPNLFNQEELIQARDNKGIYKVRPGITGLAQINKIDMSTPRLLATTDAQMINQLNLWHYFELIFLTLLGNGFGDRLLR